MKAPEGTTASVIVSFDIDHCESDCSTPLKKTFIKLEATSEDVIVANVYVTTVATVENVSDIDGFVCDGNVK